MKSMRKSLVAFAVGAALVGSGMMAAPAAAAAPALEVDHAQYLIGAPPSGVVDAKYCSSDGDAAHACFERHGDVIWVENNVGADVEVYWSNWLRNAAGAWVEYRRGQCIADALGWSYCNKDFYEDTTYNEKNGYGSGIRVYACAGDCDQNYQWVRNNA
jgi:hypothetical protein